MDIYAIILVSLQVISYTKGEEKYDDVDLKPRVFGGYDSNIGQYPFMAAVVSKNRGFVRCGATIITNIYLLSAAHCYYWGLTNKFDPSVYSVVAGLTDLSMENVTKDIDNVKIHEKYDPKFNRPLDGINDIALIKVESEFIFNEYIQPIAFPNADVRIGDVCQILGWGVRPLMVNKTYFEPFFNVDKLVGDWFSIGNLPNRLQVANVTIFNGTLCAPNYYVSKLQEPGVLRNIFDPITMICAGNPSGKVDACKGDSGGPLVCNNQLSGIISYGVNCEKYKLPAAYTNVVQYLSWIESNAS